MDTAGCREPYKNIVTEMRERMRKVIIIFIAAFVLIAAGLTFCLIYAINHGGINTVSVDESDLQLVNTQNVSMENITSIEIEYSSDDVVFYTSDTDELILKEYKTFIPEEDELSKVTASGNELSIKGGRYRSNFSIKTNFINIKNIYCKNEIYLPADYAGKIAVRTSSGNITSNLSFHLSEFKANCNSGNVSLNEVYASSIEAASSSGNITIQKAEGDERRISSTSGDITVSEGSGESEFESSSGNITVAKASGKLTAEANSGDIRISDSDGDKEIKTSSGNIMIRNSSGIVNISASSGEVEADIPKGAGVISTNSGNITLELSEVSDDIELEASSGEVTLVLPEAAGFKFKADTSSGTIRTFFDDKLSFDEDREHASGAVGASSDTDIRINTTSGNINVKDN